MGSTRRMFSRRTVVGLLTGIILGFNLASWLALPVPSHTDIEIEVIANGREREDGSKFPEFRVGAARIRHNNKVGTLKSGKDCDDEVVDYSDTSKTNNDRDNRPKLDVDFVNENQENGKNQNKNLNLLREFEMEEERRKRQKELELFYESDVGEENENWDDDSEMLEDFQYPANAKKYIDYDAEMTSQSEGRKHAARKQKPSVQNRQNALGQDQESAPFRQIKPPHDRNHFIYIGVLTAQKYLATRGRAIMDTWGKQIPGKLEFYVGEGVKNVQDGGAPLPLIKLRTVKDDAYPPQKKSFLLLKKMYDAYLNSGYQWFMRADDDVYIKTEKLEKFLRTLNSSQPIFLGQTGLGNAEERGRLSLPHGDNYCMGGPGMIFSREVVRRVGPHIRNCVRFLFSWHEDVELSRCIRRYADVNCAWSYQMQELFYEHYTLRKGYIDPHEDPTNLKLHSALTLHPNKNPHYQVKLHKFMLSQRLQEQVTRIKILTRDIVAIENYLNETTTMENYMIGVSPSLNRFVPRERDEVRPWDFMTERLWYANPPTQARRSISGDKHVAIKDLRMHVMQSMNQNSKMRGRVIDFKQVAYGYHRVNPLYGAEYVLDLLLLYKRFRGKPISIPVRRHAYLQQTFARTQLNESSPLDVSAISAAVKSRKPGLFDFVVNMVKKQSGNIVKSIGLASNRSPKSESPSAPKVLRFDSGNFYAFSEETATRVTTVNIVIPLKGRHDTFRTFMSHLEEVCLENRDAVSLLIILFTSQDSSGMEEDKKTMDLLNKYALRYPSYDLRLIPINGVFSRGLGLEIGSSYFSSDSLLFFCDIDVVFDISFTRKCRANTKNGSSVYYPILFSQFYPDFNAAWSVQNYLSKPNRNIEKLQNISAVRKMQQNKDHFDVRDTSGYWRNYGFGLLCVYKSDFTKSGGFDTSIQGWGMEDVDLVDKFIMGRKSAEPQQGSESKSNVKVFRAFDPSLVHVYHPSTCDVNLAENQLRMCKASRASAVSSVRKLAQAWSSVKRYQNSTGRVFDPVSEILPAFHEGLGSDRKKNVELKSLSKSKVLRRKRRTSKIKQKLNNREEEFR